MADFCVGLDIGVNTVRAVLLNASKTGFFVESIKTIVFDTPVLVDGAVSDYGELVHRVADLVDDSFPTKNVAIALKGQAGSAKKVLVNNDNLGEHGEFRWVADQYACVEPEEMGIDFETLPSHDLYNHTNIVMTYARKDIMIDFASIIESAKLKLAVLEPDSMSLLRLFRCVNNTDTQGTNMIIHVGYIGSIVIFAKNGFFEFARLMNKGGKVFTEVLQHDLGIDIVTAEQVKQNPEQYKDSNKVRQILERIFNTDFVLEVETVMRLYLLQGGETPRNIFLSGGASNTYGLELALAEKYEAAIRHLDPWSVISLPESYAEVLQNDKYNYSIALGLALHGKIY